MCKRPLTTSNIAFPTSVSDIMGGNRGSPDPGTSSINLDIVFSLHYERTVRIELVIY